MKLNGVGKGGIICLFVGNAFALLMGLLILALGLSGLGFSPEAGSIITVFAIMSMVLPLLIIIFGALAMVKGNNGLKIACGVLGLISAVFVWVGYLFPAILAIVGGILTLCGKFENKSDSPVYQPN